MRNPGETRRLHFVRRTRLSCAADRGGSNPRRSPLLPEARRVPQSETSSRQAVSDPLLQPFRLKHLTLKNRIMSTSHACGLAEDGMPSERYQRYHEAKAEGGIALTMFGGSSNVSPESAWQLPQINLYDERVVERFQRFSRRIHDHGTALMCQVSHVGGRGEPYAGAALAPIGPSPVARDATSGFREGNGRARHRAGRGRLRRGGGAVQGGRARRHRDLRRRAPHRSVPLAGDQSPQRQVRRLGRESLPLSG